MAQATVYGDGQFGVGDEETATGLMAGGVTFAISSEQAVKQNHLGTDVGLAIYNKKNTVSVDGVVAVAGDGVVTKIADLLTLDSATIGTRHREYENISDTAITGASTIITGVNLTLSNTGFETGSIEGIYSPWVDTTKKEELDTVVVTPP